MYINWFHHYTPKVFGSLALLVNPCFIYLTLKSGLGNYRFLLLYFATFNVVYSILDILVPMGIHSYRYCFFLFLTDGMFWENSKLHHFLLSCRCSVVACSYAILISHFIFRYLVLKRSTLTNYFFATFMTASLILCLLYFAYWALVCEYLLLADLEVRKYVREEFRSVYDGTDSMDVNMVAAVYFEASPSAINRSWTGISFCLALSTFSITLFFIFGSKIISILHENLSQMSKKNVKLQKELLKALTIQTIIPICISFPPCMIAWFAPVFAVDMGIAINYTGVVALAAFPVLDPVAIILCLPPLRKQIWQKLPVSNSPLESIA